MDIGRLIMNESVYGFNEGSYSILLGRVNDNQEVKTNPDFFSTPPQPAERPYKFLQLLGYSL